MLEVLLWGQSAVYDIVVAQVYLDIGVRSDLPMVKKDVWL